MRVLPRLNPHVTRKILDVTISGFLGTIVEELEALALVMIEVIGLIATIDHRI